ncbi:g2389 [Coccomyxa viridis]|uniref:G2389 protein n=1 Tax=Coccomyxa viridis TaxID=1274662 RepID=A0ABP1FKB0_9CHLO
MPSTGSSDPRSIRAAYQKFDCSLDSTPQCARGQGGSCEGGTEQEYLDKYFSKEGELYYMDQSRRSMHKELRGNYERNLSWARSLGIDPFAEDFNPTTPAPPELSSWLHLFCAYLQLEEVYAEALAWLNRPGHRRLIDPEPPSRSFIEEAREVWDLCKKCLPTRHVGPGSRASQHKRT